MSNTETDAITHLFKAPLMRKLNVNNCYFEDEPWRFWAAQLEADVRGFGEGERVMASLALALWGRTSTWPSDRFNVFLATRLSSDNLMYCLEAIAMRGGVLSPHARFSTALLPDDE